jgi:response regulator of citrate/malate metabolism
MAQRLQTANPEQLVYENGLLILTVLGGIKLEGLDRLRVTLKAELPDNPRPPIRHNLDLYNDTQVEKLIRKTADRLEVGTSVVAASLAELTENLEAYRLEQAKNSQSEQNIRKLLKPEEKEAAEAFLKSANLLERTNELIGQSGVIGEGLNRLLMFLIFTSRKREQPLHVVSLGSSGIGKTHLQEKVGQLMPEEETIEITTLSENAFYYFGQRELKNRLILIEDLDGAENVLYPLRELQSKRKISKTIAHKTTKGETKTIHLVVEGPVSVAGCTTKESIYEDNANRSFLLYLDESPEQDEKIMQYQRAKSAGKVNTEAEEKTAELLRNCQRILAPVKVVNPFAELLKIPQEVFKPRRSNAHYLAFIEVVTFYHQYQREEKSDEGTGEVFIETTLEDIAAANRLLKEVLLRKSDELTGACRNYFESLKMYLLNEQKQTFTSREIRSKFRLPGTTFRRYQNELYNAGYIKVRSGKQATGYQYEIVSYEEYQNLKAGIETVLDEALQRLKQAGAPAVSHSQNGSLNEQPISTVEEVSRKNEKKGQKDRKRIEEAGEYSYQVMQQLSGQEPEKMFSAQEVAGQTRRSAVTEGRYLRELCDVGKLERIWKDRQYLYRIAASI